MSMILTKQKLWSAKTYIGSIQDLRHWVFSQTSGIGWNAEERSRVVRAIIAMNNKPRYGSDWDSFLNTLPALETLV